MSNYSVMKHLQGVFKTAREDLSAGRTPIIGKRVLRWVNIERPALRELAQLDWLAVLEDLRIPPGNSLEALRGDRKGQHSIRINEQWRVCFVWTPEGPADVEIVDYH